MLAENTSLRPDFTAEHGLSLLVEFGGKRILFDTGASGAFAENARRMGIDLAGVDVAVLSHGHNDHGGGLAQFVKLNTHAPIWMAPHALDAHFNAGGKFIGLSAAQIPPERIRFLTANEQELMPGVCLSRAEQMPLWQEVNGSAGMSADINGVRMADDFRHELYMLLEEAGQRVLLSGCSHRGVLNIVSYFQPQIMVGGFHLMRYTASAHAAELTAVAQALLALPARYITGHCTGDASYRYLKTLMGKRLSPLSTGMLLEL